MFLDNVIFHFYKGGGVTTPLTGPPNLNGFSSILLTNVNKKMVFFNEGFPYCLYCKKSHQLQLKKHNFHIDVLSCRQFYPTEIAFINEQNIIQNNHMTQQQY